MTHTISRGKGSRTIRTAVAIGAATLGLVALSACEKPTPRATVTVGSDSVSTEAACYEDGGAISQEKVLSCAKQETTTSISVDEGDLLRIGVDPEIAEEGWVLFLDGQPAVTDKIGKTYRSFSGDAFFRDGEAKSVRLGIVGYDGSEYHGVWNIELKKASEG
ncbi:MULTISPECIES: DUF2771 domain-containing protein [Streptomyces]|uniref:DUF2771 domain-containing protein n=1 Tax=Streptomyces desertarenae TaxID=2666184 RepID=A0ABW4PFS1_9ACTN